MKLNADQVFPYLFQGGTPPSGWSLRDLGFSAVVLCAVEEQFPEGMFYGVDVVHAPNDDTFSREPSITEIQTAVLASRRAAIYVKEKKKVLVACHAGLNRSGFVNALTIHLLTGRSGSECIRRIQSLRKGALYNPHFVSLLSKIPARVRPTVRDRGLSGSSR